MDLRVFSATKLYAALQKHDPDGPSFRTVRRWAEGKGTPSKAEERAVMAAIGLSPETAREAAPIEGRLLASHLALERKLNVTPVELAEAEAEAMVLIVRLLGGGGMQPRQSNDGGAGGAGGSI